MIRNPPHRNDHGFTLLELLVSMTLMLLLAVLLSGGLRFGTRAWERSEAANTGMDDVRVIQGLLRNEIEQAYPAVVGTDRMRSPVDFHGSTTGLSFLGPEPQSVQRPGRARVAVSLRRDGFGLQLAMTSRPELSAASGSRNEDVLLRRVAAARLDYFGADGPNDEPAWHANWQDQATLPQLVRLRLAFPKGDGRRWPDLVVAPRIFVDANCIYDYATRRCRDRK